MLSSHLYDTYRHMEWADALIWTAVAESERLVEDEYIIASFFHLHATQHSFLDKWMGRPFVRWKQDEFDGAAAVRHWGELFHSEVTGFLAQVDEDQLDEPCILPWAPYMARVLGHDPAETTLRETMHQVSSHSMHHRGQIMRRFRELGETPPTADYIVWVWKERPEAEWDL